MADHGAGKWLASALEAAFARAGGELAEAVGAPIEAAVDTGKILTAEDLHPLAEQQVAAVVFILARVGAAWAAEPGEGLPGGRGIGAIAGGRQTGRAGNPGQENRLGPPKGQPRSSSPDAAGLLRRRISATDDNGTGSTNGRSLKWDTSRREVSRTTD